jgi:hypothetical protein
MRDDEDELDGDGDGERAQCPYCDEGKEDNCRHVLAQFDLSSGYCEGGECDMDKVRVTVRRVFHRALVDGLATLDLMSSEDLDQVWGYAKESYKPGEPPEKLAIDSDSLIRVLMEIFNDHGLDEQDDTVEGGPGMTSVTKLFFDRTPKKTFTKVLKDLERQLIEATTPEAPDEAPPSAAPVKKVAKKKPAAKKAHAKKPSAKRRSKKRPAKKNARSRPRR